MPYEIMKDGDQFCVHKQGSDSPVKCHASEDEAQAHMRALYAADDKARIERRVHLLKAINHHYAELDMLDDAAETETVDTPPEVDDHDTQPVEVVAEDEPAEVVDVETQEDTPEQKSLLARALDAFKNFTTRDEVQTGFKVVGNQWLATWSNNFKDRDGEIFPAKAIDDYVWRVDNGLVPLPELWVWHLGQHLPKVNIGKAEWVGRHEHFLLAAGTFHDTPEAQQAKAYYTKNAHRTSLSHGFTYDTQRFDGKHYHQFNTFEITLLPAGAEANRYTTLNGVKTMQLDDHKVNYIKDVFGERAEAILADLSRAGKALEELDAEFKDFASVDGGGETEAVKEAADNADKTFTDLVPDLLAGNAEAVTAATEAVKAVKAMREVIAQQNKAIDELRAELALAPRASQADETVTADDKALEALKAKAKEGEGFSPWGE